MYPSLKLEYATDKYLDTKTRNWLKTPWTPILTNVRTPVHTVRLRIPLVTFWKSPKSSSSPQSSSFWATLLLTFSPLIPWIQFELGLSDFGAFSENAALLLLELLLLLADSFFFFFTFNLILIFSPLPSAFAAVFTGCSVAGLES